MPFTEESPGLIALMRTRPIATVSDTLDDGLSPRCTIMVREGCWACGDGVVAILMDDQGGVHIGYTLADLVGARQLDQEVFQLTGGDIVRFYLDAITHADSTEEMTR